MDDENAEGDVRMLVMAVPAVLASVSCTLSDQTLRKADRILRPVLLHRAKGETSFMYVIVLIVTSAD
jgi:hypothetical protein